jgi:riboflavin kinase/FMN adenylyltransferase
LKNIIKLEKIKRGFFANNKIFAVIGFFDGVHMGHQDIIRRCRAEAKKNNGKSIVFTFDNPPKNIVHGRLYKKLITSCADKLALINNIGVDYIIIAKFNRSFSELEPENFCRDILIEKLNVSEIFIGIGFRFGKDALGDTTFLKEFFKPYGIKVHEVPIFKIGDRQVSSTSIREFYKHGDIENIRLFLGRYPSIKGIVIRGDSRGRIMGFPTANIDVFEKYVTPLDGVYIGLVNIIKSRLDGSTINSDNGKKAFSLRMPAVINIGDNPTFEGQRKWV